MLYFFGKLSAGGTFLGGDLIMRLGSHCLQRPTSCWVYGRSTDSGLASTAATKDQISRIQRQAPNELLVANHQKPLRVYSLALLLAEKLNPMSLYRFMRG